MKFGKLIAYWTLSRLIDEYNKDEGGSPLIFIDSLDIRSCVLRG